MINKEELETLVNSGLTSREIALHFGKSQTTIRYWLGKYELKLLHIPPGHRCAHEVIGKCKLCAGKRSFNHRLINRQRVYLYLLDHPCADCGESDPVVLEFDHINPSDKSFMVSTALARSDRSWSTIKQEIDKCEVRCSNCHARRTAAQFSWYKDMWTEDFLSIVSKKQEGSLAQW